MTDRTALVALRDAVQAHEYNDAKTVFSNALIDAADAVFADRLRTMADLIKALEGDLSAAERLRMALLPDSYVSVENVYFSNEGRWHWTAEISQASANHPVESIARTLAVLNALIGQAEAKALPIGERE